MADQQKFPYTTVPGKLKDLLKKIPTLGKPEKVTVAWLKKAGWTSSNDATMIPVLRFVGLLGQDGRPTILWDDVRVQDTDAKVRVANGIREAYADLFSLYPDAQRKDGEALRNFFRANTTAGEQAQTKMVQTFQTLAEVGDFDSVGEPASSGAKQTPRETKQTPAKKEVPQTGIALNVNIQLQLPATADGEVYEKLFAAMRRHLIDLTQSS